MLQYGHFQILLEDRDLIENLVLESLILLRKVLDSSMQIVVAAIKALVESFLGATVLLFPFNDDT